MKSLKLIRANTAAHQHDKTISSYMCTHIRHVQLGVVFRYYHIHCEPLNGQINTYRQGGVTRKDRIRNDNIRGYLQVDSIVDKIQEYHLRCF